MVIFLLQEIRDPHPRSQGERSRERGRGIRFSRSGKRYRPKAKHGNQSKAKSAGPSRQTSPNVL